ncbi:hypothetical protein MMC22_001582 [Lobaria immixta]|nr:hypothetical protein [Lobaria immixta]
MTYKARAQAILKPFDSTLSLTNMAHSTSPMSGHFYQLLAVGLVSCDEALCCSRESFRRLKMDHTRPALRATPKTPPTTPPIIAPVLFEDEVESDRADEEDELGEDVVDDEMKDDIDVKDAVIEEYANGLTFET